MYFICDGIRLLIWTGGRESNLFCFMSQMGAPERIWKIYFQIMPDEILVKLTQTEHMVHFQKNVYPEEDFKSVPAFPILNSRRSTYINIPRVEQEKSVMFVRDIYYFFI